MVKCLICGEEVVKFIDENRKKTYNHCINCGFISKEKDLFLTKELEKARYDTHNNSDVSYQKYLL